MIPLTFAILIGAFTNICGKILCERHAKSLPRLVWWSLLLAAYTLSHFIMLDEPAFTRMVGLCITLLLGMKIIVYMEWHRSGGRSLTWLRWIAFSFLWFDMQPKA